jgi:glycosyltransferase involved in cell wall biosynthesis
VALPQSIHAPYQTTDSAAQPVYSIIIPAYNESARIGGTLEKIATYAAQRGWQAEVIVVNDGSRDDTVAVAEHQRSAKLPVRVVDNPGNHGKGYSVRNGMLHAKGKMLLFTDADLSSPIEESEKLFAALEQGADVAIGSRWLRSDLQTQRQPLHRQLFGRIFNLALRLILGLPFKDTQCGFKAFQARAAQAIFPLQKIERWGFDPEILFLAGRFGFRTAEVPVRWAHSPGTRLNPVRDGLRMLGEAVKIRWYALTGQYPGTPST